jgi:transposase-like protein
MRTKSQDTNAPAELVLKDIRRATRKHYSAEDKIRFVLDGLRGEDSIAELCRRGHCPINVLRLVQGVPGGWQAPAG